MFEHNTYEALLKSALGRLPANMDKREGSMVFNGVAPSMAELAQLYIGLDFVFKSTYLLTAPREYLISPGRRPQHEPQARQRSCIPGGVQHPGAGGHPVFLRGRQL